MVGYPIQGSGSGSGGTGAIVVQENHRFVDTTARDAYFATVPDELVDQLYIYIEGTESLQQYYVDSTSFINVQPVVGIQGDSGGGSELTFASGETEVTLPGTPSNGQIYEYVGTGDVWTITANAGQTIRLLGYTGNTLTAEHPYACAGLVFLDNVWIVRTQVGTLDLSTV